MEAVHCINSGTKCARIDGAHGPPPGVMIQAMGNVNLGSNNSFSGCPAGSGEGPMGLIDGLYVRLVD